MRVSSTTASRILSKPQAESRAAQATYERVRAKAIELDFRPNCAAKILHSRKSNCIGLIIDFANPVNSMAILKGVADCMYEHGISVSVSSCGNEPHLERKAFAKMLYRNVDAIIWHPVMRRFPFKNGQVEALLQKILRTTPVVCINQNAIHGIFKFRLNGEEDAASAAKRQLDLGCKKFAVISGKYGYLANVENKNAYIACLLEHGIRKEAIVELVLGDKKTRRTGV